MILDIAILLICAALFVWFLVRPLGASSSPDVIVPTICVHVILPPGATEAPAVSFVEESQAGP